jgi:hypothetical protein
VCAPGESSHCAGPAGCTGYQLCRSDGSGFDPCVCGSDGGPADANADAVGRLDGTPDTGDASSPDAPLDAPVDSQPGSDAKGEDGPTDAPANGDGPNSDGPNSDGSNHDASNDDATTVEASIIDGSNGDVTAVDAATTDVTIVDVTTVDVTTVDVTSMDVTTMDVTTVDVTAVDVTAVDTGTVDVTTVDAATVDAPTGDASSTQDGSSNPDGGTALCEQAACPTGTKRCGAFCVSIDNPANGCGDPTSCSYVYTPHAVPSCDAKGHVTIVACHPGFADCDGVASNGCEASLASPSSCTQCGNVCATGQVCNPDGCASTCNPPLVDCSGSCVDTSTDPFNCGSCGYGPCAPGADLDYGQCIKGQCTASYVCAPGALSDPTTGTCYETTWDTRNCGSTGNVCPSTNSWAECDKGQCATVCPDGYTDCGGGDCEYLPTSKASCGVCGVPCAGTAECINGQCLNDSTITLVSGLHQPEDLAVDGTDLFFTTLGDNFVYKTTTTGGPLTVVASNQNGPMRIALDADNVYWTSTGGNAIIKAPRSGTGKPSLVANTTSAPGALAVSNGHVYWIDGAQISYVPTTGGTPAAIAGSAGQVDSNSGLVVANGSIYAQTFDASHPFGGAPLPTGAFASLPVTGAAVAPVGAADFLSYGDGYLYSGPISYSFATGMLSPGPDPRAQDEVAVGCVLYVLDNTYTNPFNSHLNVVVNAANGGPSYMIASIGLHVTSSFRRLVESNGHLYWTDAGDPTNAAAAGYVYGIQQPSL